MAPKKKKTRTQSKKSRAGKKVSAKKVAKKKPAKKKSVARKTSAKKSAPKRNKTSARSRKKSTASRKAAVKPKLSISKVSGINGHGIPGLNYRTIEMEISRLTELLQTIRRKNKLVKKSLAYLEREQKKVAKQIQDAKKYLTRLKNRGIRAIRGFPDNAEEIFYQLKGEITRISRRLGIR